MPHRPTNNTAELATSPLAEREELRELVSLLLADVTAKAQSPKMREAAKALATEWNLAPNVVPFSKPLQ